MTVASCCIMLHHDHDAGCETLVDAYCIHCSHCIFGHSLYLMCPEKVGKKKSVETPETSDRAPQTREEKTLPNFPRLLLCKVCSQHHNLIWGIAGIDDVLKNTCHCLCLPLLAKTSGIFRAIKNTLIIKASNGLRGIVCGEPSSALNDARRDVHEGNSAILGK